MAQRPAARVWWLAALPALAALLLLAWHYHPFFADDALISLRYAQRLLDGDGLTWNDGERVEGYSNLLWTLAVAALGSLGLDLVVAARILGLLSSAVTIVLVVWTLRRGRDATAAAAIAALAFAASSPTAVWAIGGLEQPLYVALLIAAAIALAPVLESEGDPSGAASRRVMGCGALLAMACLTRPDGPLFVAVYAGAVVAAGRGARGALRNAARLCTLPAVATLGQLAFRQAYYGEWLPNTAYMKVSFSRERLVDGLGYVGSGLLPLLPLVALMVPALWAVRRRDLPRSVLLGVAASITWLLYVAVVGGDIFPAFRHWTPPIAFGALLAGQGASVLFGVWRRGLSRALAWIAVLALIATSTLLQMRHPRSRHASLELWEWDGEAVGRMLGSGFDSEQPLIAVTAAGCIPYFSRLPALDMLGLNDKHIARLPSSPGGGIGHDKADGSYVLDREPDVILFNVDGGPPYMEVGLQLERDPRLKRDYRSVAFRALDPHTVFSDVLVRREGRAGVRRAADRVEYPAYLLSGVTGQVGPRGRMAALLTAQQPAVSERIEIGSGRWELRVEPPPLSIAVRVRGPMLAPASTAEVNSFEALSSGSVTIELTASLGTLVERVVLRRLAPSSSSAPDPDPSAAARGLGAWIVVQAASPFPPAGARTIWRSGFEDGMPGWTVEGRAFGETVRGAVGDQQRVENQIGLFVDSYHSERHDAALGRAESPPVQVPEHAWISLLVGGGAASELGVRLLVDGKVLQHWYGSETERLEWRALDLSTLAGRAVRIELIDREGGDWGHMLADEIEVWHAVPDTP